MLVYIMTACKAKAPWLTLKSKTYLHNNVRIFLLRWPMRLTAFLFKIKSTLFEMEISSPEGDRRRRKTLDKGWERITEREREVKTKQNKKTRGRETNKALRCLICFSYWYRLYRPGRQCNESVLCIRWAKYWSFSLSISPSNEYSGLISFRTDWLDLLAV